MKTTELTLDLQAYVDGELPPLRRAEIETALAGDAEARELVAGLRNLGELLRANEPEIKVPDSREFYWSQIQRQIDAGKVRDGAETPASSALGWLRWLVPALGVAAVAVVVTFQQRPGVSVAGGNGPGLTAGNEASAMTFISEADGVTISWIN